MLRRLNAILHWNNWRSRYLKGCSSSVRQSYFFFVSSIKSTYVKVLRIFLFCFNEMICFHDFFFNIWRVFRIFFLLIWMRVMNEIIPSDKLSFTNGLESDNRIGEGRNLWVRTIVEKKLFWLYWREIAKMGTSTLFHHFSKLEYRTVLDLLGGGGIRTSRGKSFRLKNRN